MNVENLTVDRATNLIEVGRNVELSGSISGVNNVVIIRDANVESRIRLHINGNNNRVVIGESYQIKDLSIYCGNHVPAYRTVLEIGDRFSIEPGSAFLLYNSGSVLEIGSDCMFSNNVTIRCGESPHLIFDTETQMYLDTNGYVSIGDHVWVGERVYITKKAALPAHSIAAACAVVARRHTETHSVFAGNPAKQVRKNIRWIRNADFLQSSSEMSQSLQAYWDGFSDDLT